MSITTTTPLPPPLLLLLPPPPPPLLLLLLYYIYREKFGLYQVDFSDPIRHRVPKLSANIFSAIVQKRQLPLRKGKETERLNGAGRNKMPTYFWLLFAPSFFVFFYVFLK